VLWQPVAVHLWCTLIQTVTGSCG